MKYLIKFYPEKRGGKVDNVPIYMVVIYGDNVKMNYYTGIRCHVKQWDKSEMKLRMNQTTEAGLTSAKLNEKLRDLKQEVKDLFEKYDDSLPTKEQLRNDLNFATGKTTASPDSEKNLYDYFQIYIDENKNSDSRRKIFQSVLVGMKSNQPTATFNNFDLKKYADSLTVKPNSRNTYLNALKVVYKHFLKLKVVTVNPFDEYEITPASYDNAFYLTIQERDLLYNTPVRKSLELTKDYFLLQTFTGCRIGDLQRFTKTVIQEGCLVYKDEKSKKHEKPIISVPLSEKAKSIISKYNDIDNLLPKYSICAIDKNIKTLFAEVGLNRLIAVTDQKTGLEKFVPLYEKATSHVSRKTFIGTMFNKNVPLEVIGSMTGHVKGSKAMTRYYEIDDSQKLAALRMIE